MSNAKRNRQMEFEEIVKRFMEEAADWESRGLVRPETGLRVRGVPTRGAIPTRGMAVRTRGAMPAAKPSTISELVEGVKPQLSKASLIFILDGDYNEAASRFCKTLAEVVGEGKEPAAWWINPDGQEPSQWPWPNVVEIDWHKERDRRIAGSLAPDIVFVSASPHDTQLQRTGRWRSARSIVVEESSEVTLQALGTVKEMPPVLAFTEKGALHPLE